MNENIELIKQLISFCKRYEEIPCIYCPAHLNGEEVCPTLSLITRLAKKEFGYDENGDIDLPI